MHFMNIFVCDVYKHRFPPRNVSLLFGLVQNPLEDSYIIHSIKHSGQFNIINKRQKYYDIQQHKRLTQHTTRLCSLSFSILFDSDERAEIKDN